jgi:hypothetical protein
MSRTRLVSASAALLLVAACAPTLGPPPPPPPPSSTPPSPGVFRPEDFSWSAVPGPGRIEGRLAYRAGQTRYSCAGTPSAPSGDYSAFVKRTVCDQNSRFSFSGLANGAWYVITVAKPVGAPGPDIAIMKRVEVRGGRTVALDL